MNAEEWRRRAADHAARIDRYVAPHLARRGAAVKHPVFDFLFTYYSYRPAQLRRWHPGFGVVLDEAAEYANLKGYGPPEVEEVAQQQPEVEEVAQQQPEVEEVAQQPSRDRVTVAPSYLASQRSLVASIHELLTATAGRAPHFGCFGLHEWAMVYRLAEDETRHADWPLRLGPAGTDEVVEGHRIGCSHFDAYRFFTPPARPLNTLNPGRDDRPAFEQPGCLHAGMDLYKHAFRLSPLVCSDLVADCFELAWDIRTLDMRASPYDLADLGFEPVPIETTEGKRQYAEAQRSFAERGAPLRQRLIEECEHLLAPRR